MPSFFVRMVSNMKDYSKMSDFEICGYVSMHEHGFSWIEFDDEMSSHVKCGNEGSPGFAIVEVKDYCNNPPDAWPIMKESLIGVTPDEDGVTMHFYGDWTAMAHCKNLQFTDKNPLRAAMIVYLMMKDEEQ